MTARTDFAAGVRIVTPIMLGVVPFGLIAGVTAVNAGIPPLQAVAMSWIVFAGASQLAAIDLIGRTAPVAVVVFTVFVINLRMVMYSASIAPHFEGVNSRAKILSAYLLTDQAYAVSITEYARTDPAERNRKWYYLGAAVTLWAVWQVSTIAGVVLGSGLPAGLSLEFAVPLTFMALVFPAIEDRATATAALVAGFGSIVFAPLPFNLGLIVSAVVGISVGVLMDVRDGSFPAPQNTGGDSS